MKKDLSSIKDCAIIFLIAVAAISALYLVFWGAFKKYGNSLVPARTLSVSAEGSVFAKPDIAKIYFGVVSEGKTAKEVTDDNNKKMSAAIDFLKLNGISEDDIKTSSYNLAPRYEYDKLKRTTFISGYTITQTVAVKIRDFNKIDEIVGQLPSVGINQIDSLSFDIEDDEKYLSEARNEALTKAKQKASDITSGMHVSLGKVVSFNESQSGIIRPYAYLAEGAKNLAMPSVASIEPGTQEIKINVNVVYEVK